MSAQAATTRAARNLMTARGWSQADLAEEMTAAGVLTGASGRAGAPYRMTVKTLANRLGGYRKWSVDDVDVLAYLGAGVQTLAGAVPA